MKKGTIPIILLCVLLFLLVIVGIVTYNLLYVPSDYVMRIENVYQDDTNVVYIYENGKVLLNNGGINKLKYQMSEEDVSELLEEISDNEIQTKLFVVTTSDGQEIYVQNNFIHLIEEKIEVDDIFEEGTK